MNKIADVDIRIKQGKEYVEECFDEVLYLIENDLEISKIFKGREDRLATSAMLSTIYDKDKLIVITQIEESNYNSKASKIKNTEVLLYEDGNKLKSIFKVNETTISIETQKLTKQEFIKIIKSIIK